jgi:hypothetical protein
MTATTSTTGTRRGQGIVLALRTTALAAGWLLTAIGAGWKAIGDAGQMGPDVERSISRHTGARI